MLKIKEMENLQNEIYNKRIADDIDNFLEFALGRKPDELGNILPSDTTFYKKLTQHIMPDEDWEEANKTILDLFLKVKADTKFVPTDEQLILLTLFLDYAHIDDYNDDNNEDDPLHELFGTMAPEDVTNELLGE